MARVDEREWLIQAQQGDGTAFAELVRRHQTAVFNVAYRLLGRRQDAEDVTQEAFMCAYRALDTFDVERPFAPWIKRITTNLCYNWLNKERTRPTVFAADLSREGEEAADFEELAKSPTTPEQTLTKAEQADQVRAALLQLPPRYRVVVELRHFQDLSYAEIAEIVKRPLSTVKSDLFRGRKKLAALLRNGN
ncbi:MAG: RNA polymerase subunit sigma [Chloroflexi bacterium]|nr:MAG: RNA polymerase subunit sigma [Chloroflexota bacterium]PIE80512.1 MAG: RNA polymerase subunit sigma [Chloroflexota bacterium]